MAGTSKKSQQPASVLGREREQMVSVKSKRAKKTSRGK